jgi:hypothetical protein
LNSSLSNAINGIKVIHGRDSKAQDFTPGFHETEDDNQKLRMGFAKIVKTQDFTPGFPETEGDIQKFRRELKFPLNPS